MKSIKKFEQLPPDIQKTQKESGEEFNIGDMYFNTHYSDTRVLRIREIRQTEVWAKPNDQHDRTKIKEWEIAFDHATTWDASKWSGWGTCLMPKFIEGIKDGTYVKIDQPLSRIMEEANKVIAGETSIDVYSHSEYDEGMNNENALMARSSKDYLTSIQKNLEGKKRIADLIHSAVSYEMQKRKQALEKIRSNLYEVVAKFEKQVKKIMRVINTIELYLGIEEEIHQIQSGDKCSSTTPISFRQMVLYIDEEVGAHEEGGLDFRDVEQFDEWLLKENNLDIVLPERKGIVVLNPRRNEKDYGQHIPIFVTAEWNKANLNHTYILIRNGDNVYRIFTEKLQITDTLFPLRGEMNTLFERLQKADWDRDKEKIEDSIYHYKDRAMMLQGIVDRTDIFHPLPVERLNIFKLDEAGEYVNFIYDAEAALTQGKKLFKDWRKDINNEIKEGSRILLTGKYNETRHDLANRFYLAKNSYDGLKKVPDLPKSGVYEVEEFIPTHTQHYKESAYKEVIKKYNKEGVKFKDEGILKHKNYVHPDEKTGSKAVYVIKTFDDEIHMTIMYMPKAEASKGWGRWNTHERKNRTRFRIWTDDTFVMNYDQIDVSDINYYLRSRVDREQYLSMMPFLKETRKHLLEEQRNEAFFVDFVVGRNIKHLPKLSEKQIKTMVLESIVWWKYKNKWKRAITKDDTLALRMIEKRITSPNYDKLVKQQRDE